MTAIRRPPRLGEIQQEAYRVVCANPTARTRDVALAMGRDEDAIRRSLYRLKCQGFVYKRVDPAEGATHWYPVETEGGRE